MTGSPRPESDEEQAVGPGGAGGILAEPEAETHIGGARYAEPAVALEDIEPPRVEQFRVRNGGIVVLDSCRTGIRAGKVVDSTMYDLSLLKRQGIVLDAIAEDEPPRPTIQPFEDG